MDRIAEVNALGLAERWWTLTARGLAAIGFGLVALLAPGLTLLALVYAWAVYAVVDGIFNLVHAFRDRRSGRPWGWMIFGGVMSVIAGVMAAAWPGVTGVVLLLLIAAWAVVTGIAEIAAAVRLRKQIPDEWILGLSGAVSLVFGLFLFANPSTGALVIVSWIAAYALIFGVLNLILSFRLRAWTSRLGPPQLRA